MTAPNARSALEEGRLGITDITAGQRYTVLIVAVLTAVVLLTGLPDGKISSGSAIGAIPDLSPTAGAAETRRTVSTEATTAVSAPALDTGTFETTPAFETTPVTEPTASELAPPDETTTTTTTTTQPPGPVPLPLPLAPPAP